MGGHGAAPKHTLGKRGLKPPLTYLLSLEQNINTASAAGELVFHVFGAIAHFERRLIAERIKKGIAAARARGKRPGRQPLDTDKIAAAIKLVQAGLSPTAAARQVGLGRSTCVVPECDGATSSLTPVWPRDEVTRVELGRL